MERVCHRCSAELPERLPGVEALLFCPHCSAPQILLPEAMRVVDETAGAGAPPPPRVTSAQGIDWQAVLPTAAWVAVVGGLLSVLGQKSAFADYLSPLWVLASGSIVLGFYLRRRPGAKMNGLAGWRIGLVTGLLLVGAKGMGLSATGMVARFGTHSMEAYDAQSRQDLQASEVMALKMQRDPKSQEMLAGMYERLFESPERRAGWTLAGGALTGLSVLLFAGLGGMFSGAVERRRRLVVGGVDR